MSLCQTETVTIYRPSFEFLNQKEVKTNCKFDSTAVRNSLRAYNAFIDEEQTLRCRLDECTSDVDRLKTEVEELLNRATTLTSDNAEAERKAVGQVYYRFQELVKEKVFGETYFPVYTIRDIEDAFKEDEEDSIFNDPAQKSKFESKWEDIKSQISWAGEADFDMVESLEVFKYGYCEPRLTLPQLRNSLKEAKKAVGLYGNNDLQNFERLIDICEQLSQP